MEVFRLRLLDAWSKGDERPPRAVFPYVDKPIDYEAVRQDALRLDAELESDGKGGYRWKTQPSEEAPEVPRIGDRTPPAAASSAE